MTWASSTGYDVISSIGGAELRSVKLLQALTSTVNLSFEPHRDPCSTKGEKRNAYRIFAGKSEGNRPLGSSRRRSVDNIKMDLREIEWGSMVTVNPSCVT
jgi:hypothetical protein